MAKRRKKQSIPFVISLPRVLICLFLLAALVGAYLILPRVFHWNENTKDETNALIFHTVDVGQGDCTIVQFPDDKVLMVDTGKSDAYDTIIEYLANLRINTIDWLVVSHPDDDHYGAAPKLLKNSQLTFKTKFCENSSYEKNNQTYQNMIRDYDFTVPEDGYIINSTVGYKITFVSPYHDDEIKTSNDASIMMTIEYYNKIFVLTGDASTKVEPFFIAHATQMGLFNNTANQQIILKAGHHGSETSSSTAFLDFIFSNDHANNFVLISCGKDNSYGHPHAAAIERLGQYCNADNILITKDVGSVVIKAGSDYLTINGKDYHVSYTAIFVSIGGVIILLCFVDFSPRKKRSQ